MRVKNILKKRGFFLTKNGVVQKIRVWFVKKIK
jgi:hypothetical protein